MGYEVVEINLSAIELSTFLLKLSPKMSMSGEGGCCSDMNLVVFYLPWAAEPSDGTNPRVLSPCWHGHF